MILFCGLTFPSGFFFFFFNDTATTEIYTLSLHDALPICFGDRSLRSAASLRAQPVGTDHSARGGDARSGGHRAAAARRSGAVAVRQVPDGLQEIESHPGCL